MPAQAPAAESDRRSSRGSSAKGRALNSDSKESKNRKAPSKAKPLDVSNGKALFKKYQNIEYNSVTQGAWLDVQVIMVREDGAIMIDLKDRFWFDPEEQKTKFRDGGRKPYLLDSELQYFSSTQGGWVDCIVVNQNKDGVQINIKENYWMSVAEQDEKLRLPLYDRSDEVVWESGKLLKMEPPDCRQAEQKLRTLLQEETDLTLAMETLATLLRDYYQDYTGAEELYQRALNDNPFEIKVLSDFGDLLKFRGRAKEAEEMHQRWRKVRDKMKEIEDEMTAG